MTYRINYWKDGTRYLLVVNSTNIDRLTTAFKKTSDRVMVEEL